MPTLGAHFSDAEAEDVKKAARVSDEQQVGPYIAVAVRQRMEREGMLPGNPRSELLSAAEEVGIEDAIATLKREAAKKKRRAA
jgi:hypothetical protein